MFRLGWDNDPLDRRELGAVVDCNVRTAGMREMSVRLQKLDNRFESPSGISDDHKEKAIAEVIEGKRRIVPITIFKRGLYRSDSLGARFLLIRLYSHAHRYQRQTDIPQDSRTGSQPINSPSERPLKCLFYAIAPASGDAISPLATTLRCVTLRTLPRPLSFLNISKVCVSAVFQEVPDPNV